MKTRTIVNFILDKSGSMSSIQRATISGFNEYIQTLKNDKESNYEFTLTLFDTGVTVSEPKVIQDVKELNSETYMPNGGTALYDAVCSTILKTVPSKGDKVVTVIMTDGEENASREYKLADMKKMIEAREKMGNWTFVYLGANQDSYQEAAKFGIAYGNTANFHATSAGAGGVFRGMGMATTAYSCSAATTTDSFLVKNKEEIENTK